MHGTATKLQTPRKIEVSGAVTGNANFDGSNNVTIVTKQTNVAVIEGTVQLAANSSDNLSQNKALITTKEINYPQGFTANNSVVISTGTVNNVYISEKGLAYGDIFSSNVNSQAMLSGAMPKNVSLQPKNILLFIGNISTQVVTYKYKIVLLKVS